MSKKGTLSLILGLVLLLGASALTASDWVGTYDGDDQGVIEGTLNESTDPAIYEGTWESYLDYPHNYGTWYGRAEEIVNGWFVVREGEIYDDEGTYIGHWSGTFPPCHIDGIASGDWWRDNGWQGTWIAWKE
ncbi:MAG: hypothetical protein E3J71_02110 [Candidatus Stahlbacteria bacterium]|nr:MAG: hypothetical protein E3J71_02110 [Candidatus Stahlbacteria bacterium]